MNFANYESNNLDKLPFKVKTLVDYDNGLTRGFKKGADWQAKQSPWIKVKDQLPSVDENDVSMQSDRVLVQPSSKEWFEPEILIYNKYYHVWDSEDGDDYEYEISDDDLWMPIPSFDEILEANKDVLERIKEKGVKNEIS